MPPRRKVRRTSSLPGLASDDPTGLSAVLGHPRLVPQAAAQAAAATPAPRAPVSTTEGSSIPQPPILTGPYAPGPVLPTPTVPPPAYSFTFTTNLTPTTFQHADKSKPLNPNNGEPDSAASPANSTSSASRKRNADALDDFYTESAPVARKDKREKDEDDAKPAASSSSSRKNQEGHIPRPPNAFILFRSDLVARKAVPTSLEADHSTISKIIGVCWRTLPARQRKRWEQKAQEAKALHKERYPDYRYTPVHRKGPQRKKPKREQKKDDKRAEELAQLLLAGSKGDDLEARVKKLDESNPDTYQTTLNFGTNSSANLHSGPQQFTFVQGFPAAGHTIGLPVAPPYVDYNSTAQPATTGGRRHSSAPPPENVFGSSSSTASTPRTPARELSAHHFPLTGGDPAAAINDVPLSRIARKLPTKSTHHLQPHHFHQEAQLTAAAAAAAASSSSGSGSNGKKIKSSLAKAVRSRAQGFGAPQPASERDQLFIQSHWTTAAISGDAAGTGSNGTSKKKKKNNGLLGGIPRELMLPTWDLNSNANAANNTNDAGDASPTFTVPEYGAPEPYSPAFLTGSDEKYGGHFVVDDATATPPEHHPLAYPMVHTDPLDPTNALGGVDNMGHLTGMDMSMLSFDHPTMPQGHPTDGMIGGTYDLLGYQDYALSGLDADGNPLESFNGDLNGAMAAFGSHTSGLVAPGSGFDFADQFGSLGVDTEEYGYPYYGQADLGSGPGSAHSTSPHNSDADDAAAYHPYDVPGTLAMSAQDPLGAIAFGSPRVSATVSAQSAPVHHMPAPDWSAFENNGINLPPAPAVSVDPLDPLDAPPPPNTGSSASASPHPPTMTQSNVNAFSAYRSAPTSEVGDLDYQDMHMPPSYATTTASNGQQQRQQQQLRLNTHYVHQAPGVYSATASPVVEHMGHFTMRPPVQQPAPGSAATTSPLVYTVQHPQTPMSAMGPPPSPMHAHPMQQHMHAHSHSLTSVGQSHQRQMSGVLHTHHPSHSIESFHEILPPTAGTPVASGLGGQWGEWTHPDPFGAPAGAESVTQEGASAMSGAMDPLARHGHHPHAMSVSMTNAYHGV
ncbi:hypothetical protein PIIN_06327 [Serendipita indica DSM 11827]|uniref:HMG box domain-containing protein n=1 Tax=Serendipita indica (strain DSM 11827) TaxID=1109443 RepID=G4TM50_SERID|nr:hypothetical protein PIIN_06327 [Serendipita indica DSM 11827]